LVNLQKFTLWHGAAPPSMRMLAPAQNTLSPDSHHHHLHFGMLEAQPLDHVGQFDVDAEVVGC
jgi:hypothetical protein